MARYANSKREPRKPISTMKRSLIIVLIIAVVFTTVMIYLFMTVGAIPDTLCTCVFALLGGECGVLGWIKTTNERMQDRKWIVQDRKEEQALIKEMEDASNV